jgi:hypothetical protein
VISTRVVNSPLKTHRERGLVSHLLFTFWPGGFAGSYFYHSYYLISVKHHKVKFLKDTVCFFKTVTFAVWSMFNTKCLRWLYNLHRSVMTSKSTPRVLHCLSNTGICPTYSIKLFFRIIKQLQTVKIHHKLSGLIRVIALGGLIDLWFYVPLKNFSLIWRHHHCWWRAAKFRPMLGAQGLWAGRDLYRATPAMTPSLSFSGLIRRTAPFSRLLQHTRGCGGSILTPILMGHPWVISRHGWTN